MENIIDQLIDRTGDWLRYAETKNAALVAYAGVLIGWLSEAKNESISILGMVLSFIGLAIALWSFLPKSNSHAESGSENQTLNEENFNLFAWPDLARATPQFVLHYIQCETNSSNSHNSFSEQLFLTQIDQLIILAQITQRKNTMFKCALAFCMAGTLFLALDKLLPLLLLPLLLLLLALLIFWVLAGLGFRFF